MGKGVGVTASNEVLKAVRVVYSWSAFVDVPLSTVIMGWLGCSGVLMWT